MFWKRWVNGCVSVCVRPIDSAEFIAFLLLFLISRMFAHFIRFGWWHLTDAQVNTQQVHFSIRVYIIWHSSMFRRMSRWFGFWRMSNIIRPTGYRKIGLNQSKWQVDFVRCCDEWASFAAAAASLIRVVRSANSSHPNSTNVADTRCDGANVICM